MLKDLDTALDLAREANAPLPMAGHAQQLLRLMAARGLGEDDPAALVRLYRPTA
jgi:3-hydroxyisobutyrate dehydrogenase